MVELGNIIGIVLVTLFLVGMVLIMIDIGDSSEEEQKICEESNGTYGGWTTSSCHFINGDLVEVHKIEYTDDGYKINIVPTP